MHAQRFLIYAPVIMSFEISERSVRNDKRGDDAEATLFCRFERSAQASCTFIKFEAEMRNL